MPQVFKVGSYWIFFWANENDSLEPVHVHVAEGAPTANGTKIWITKAGKCLLCTKALPTGTLQRYGLQRLADAFSVITIQGFLLAFSVISWM